MSKNKESSNRQRKRLSIKTWIVSLYTKGLNAAFNFNRKDLNMKEPLLTGAPVPDSNHDPSRSTSGCPSSLRSILPSGSGDPHSNYSATSFNHQDSWIKHPKVKENWRTVIASAILSILGITLLTTGIVVAFTPARGYHCLIFGVIGLLCLIPGGYHFVYIYCAAVGRPGYEFENLPVLR
ncbi:hypothetical protein RRG08_021311 [Elysia crispata]|uniref:Transmembrane protein 134 n=1 Tax=Elysia crispata TaxID=231223 RepID=A0AAE0XTF9_9GAST|nr:hypothetical protein RRG08_021311 [Elysia crispata]